MRKDILIATNLSLITGLGLSACKSIGARDFNPDSASNNPNSTETSPTMVPFPKIEPLYEKDIKVFLDNCQNCEELGITMETVTGGYFGGGFLFHSKDKNDADYFYLNQGTFFEPLNWESTDSEFALVPKANEGDIYTGLKYFIWNPNVTDDSGNMIVTYQPDGTPNSAQNFILPSNNDIEPRLKRARFTAPEISPESLLPQEVKEKFDMAGIEMADMENAEYDKDGLHITLPDGEVIVLTNDQLAKGIYNGQDNVLQYRDEANQNVIYAFDKEEGKWEVALESTETGAATIAKLNQVKIDPDSITLKMDGKSVVCYDKKTGDEVCRDGVFDLLYLYNNLPPDNFEQSNYVPTNGKMQTPPPNFSARNIIDGRQDFVGSLFSSEWTGSTGLLLHDFTKEGGKYGWGIILHGTNDSGKAISYLAFNDKDHNLTTIQIEYIPDIKVVTFHWDVLKESQAEQ